jgi:hypothetical protein
MGFFILCAFVIKASRKNYAVINMLKKNEKYKKRKCISTSTEQMRKEYLTGK